MKTPVQELIEFLNELNREPEEKDNAISCCHKSRCQTDDLFHPAPLQIGL